MEWVKPATAHGRNCFDSIYKKRTRWTKSSRLLFYKLSRKGLAENPSF